MRMAYPRSCNPKEWHESSDQREKSALRHTLIWAIKQIFRPCSLMSFVKLSIFGTSFEVVPVFTPSYYYLHYQRSQLVMSIFNQWAWVSTFFLKSIPSPLIFFPRCIWSRVVSTLYPSSTPEYKSPISQVPLRISSQARLSPSRRSWNHLAHLFLAKEPIENSSY